MTGRSYKIKMLGDGIIVLPDEVMQNSRLKKDDEVEFYMGDGWIEMHRVKPLRPFTLTHPLLQMMGMGEGRRPDVAQQHDQYLKVAGSGSHGSQDT